MSEFVSPAVTGPNVLLVVMDSVRARNTSLHDHRRDTTPFLADLAGSATSYRNARAPSQWSLPSHASIFTGLHVPEHGVTADGDALAEGATVFDNLADRGYRTGVFSENPYLTGLETGLASGFDIVEGAGRDPAFDGLNPDGYKGEPGSFLRAALTSGRPARSLANGVVAKLVWDHPHLLPDGLVRRVASGTTPGSTFTDLFLDWVDDGSGPWAACINYMDAHHPYDPRPAFDRWDDGSIAAVQRSLSGMPMGFYTGRDPWWKAEVLEPLYDGTVRQIDDEVEQLVTRLRDRGAFGDTLVIVTSDHGEGFGERNPVRGIRLAGHNVGEHEANLHVPLVVSAPAQAESATVDRPVSLTGLRRVIERAVDGGRDPDLFEEHEVVARTQGLRASQRAELAEAGLETAPFEGAADVRYVHDDCTVTKHVVWGEESTAVRCIGARTSHEVGAADEAVVRETFTAFEDADIRSDAGDPGVDEVTARRLEELGYR